MSSTKRRLSSNSGLLKMCDDENSDEDDLASVGLQEKSIYTFPKKSNARRRSSFGGLNSSKSPVNAAEQARITEMYKTVIQMSSENKLNEKNSWNYDLIDHMGKLIKDESRGVNFQKASCTLDASVKIYSNRVDDTYTSSHRILESLSRNGTSNNPADADEDNDAEEGDNTEGPRKRGTKTSTRLNIATTIERNISALNAVKLENDVAVDPMFHKISKAFDEGGAKGMLMNNLRTASTGCSLSFHFTDPDPTATAANSTDDTSFPSSLIDISDLLARSGISASELSELCVCPALDMYRDQIGLSSEHLLGSVKEVLTSTAMHAIPSASGDDTHLTAVAKVASSQRQSLGGEWEDINNDNDFGYSGHDDGDDFASSAPPSARPSLEPFNTRLSGIAGSPNRASLAGSISGGDNHEGHKLRWADEAVPGNPSMAADMEVLVQGLESVTISNSGPSEYSYFDTNAIFSSSNAWAGARHWKYATRKRVAKETEITPEENSADNVPSDTEGATTTTTKGAKKSAKATKKTTKKVDNKAGIDFSAELVDVSLFDLPSAKSKSDTTQQTAAAIAKLQSAAATLFLPPDAKVQVKDLCRLYLAPHVMIPANNVQRAVLASSSVRRSGSNKIDRFLAGQSGSERVWGVSGPTNLQTAVRAGASGNAPSGVAGAASGNEGGYDSGDDGFAYADYDDGGHYEGSASSGAGAGDALPPVLSGLDINTGQLLQADRKVEKIEIGYAKVSKRVNIQRLKIDIWSNLSSQLPVEAEPATPPHRPPQQQLSFQEIITEIAGEDGGARQQDVTLPFYFICLLHLANEHGLRIEDREDMSDLVISMDQNITISNHTITGPKTFTASSNKITLCKLQWTQENVLKSGPLSGWQKCSDFSVTMSATGENKDTMRNATRGALSTTEPHRELPIRKRAPRLSPGWHTVDEIFHHDDYVASRAYEHKEYEVNKPVNYHYTQREMFDRMLQEARETNNFHIKKQLKAGLYFEDCPMHQQMVHGLFEKDRKKRDGAVEPEPTVQIFNLQLEEASDNKGTQEKRPTMIHVSYDTDGQRILSTVEPVRKRDPRLGALFRERQEQTRMWAEDVYEINCDEIVFTPQTKPHHYLWDLFFNQTPALYAAMWIVSGIQNAVDRHIEASEDVEEHNK